MYVCMHVCMHVCMYAYTCSLDVGSTDLRTGISYVCIYICVVLSPYANGYAHLHILN